jgi:hypothetical protein
MKYYEWRYFCFLPVLKYAVIKRMQMKGITWHMKKVIFPFCQFTFMQISSHFSSFFPFPHFLQSGPGADQLHPGPLSTPEYVIFPYYCTN